MQADVGTGPERRGTSLLGGSRLGKALSNLLESGSKWGFDLLWHKLLRLLLHSTRVLLDDTCI